MQRDDYLLELDCFLMRHGMTSDQSSEWVHTELEQDERREEVEQMLESSFVDDSEIVNEDAENDSDEEDDDVEMQEGDLTPVTTEKNDELAAEMTGIVGKLKKLDCDGE